MAVSFDLDGEVVIFAPQSRGLFLLNPAASLVWLALEKGCTHEEAARYLADAAGIPPDVARRDCDAVIQQWQDSSLLSGPAEPGADVAVDADAWWPEPRGWSPAARTEPTIEATYQIVDFRFLLRTAASEHDKNVHEYLSYLAAPGIEPDYVLDLTPHGPGWQLALQGQVIDDCDSADTLVPMIHRTLLVCAWRGSASSVAIHASILILGTCTLLLAGTSGVGKSTLTAALMADGFGFCSDDMVLLSDSPVRMRGVPTLPRLRDGAWPVVEPLWPEMKSLPAHRRVAGGRVRYLRPQNLATIDGPETYREANLLVFPAYREGAALSLERMGKAESLMQLTEAGYDFADVISEDLISGLIDWVSGLDCYRLEYGSLDEAVNTLRSLAAQTTVQA